MKKKVYRERYYGVQEEIKPETKVVEKVVEKPKKRNTRKKKSDK